MTTATNQINGDIFQGIGSAHWVKGQRLEDCFPILPKDGFTQYVTNGRWDMADLLFHILKTTAPSIVSFTTWQINDDAVVRLRNALESGAITKLNALLDRRIKIRNEKSLEFIKQFANVSNAVDVHAKVTAIQGRSSYTIISSANFTNNRRIESGVVVPGHELASWNAEWICNQIDENHETL